MLTQRPISKLSQLHPICSILTAHVQKSAELQKYKRYEIVMTAYNIIGESPASAPVEVFVGEAVAPQNIQVNTISSTQLEVQWEPPPVETQNGIIQGYKIYYWEMDNQNETEKVKILFLPETSMRLKNLTSYTYYMVKLSAFNAAGDGPLSEPRRGRTLQAAPSAPSFISFSEVTSTTLNVSWGFPVSPNGVVEGYRVVYEPTAPIHGVSKVVTVDIQGSWQRWLKVRDLSKGVTYSFRVQAKTISYGPEAEANITAGPMQGSPGSPLETSITKSGSTLTIHWTPGDTGAGRVTGYVIEARPSDEGLWDTFVRHLPPASTSHIVSLDRLRQGVSYQFRVLAINDYGYGEPSAPSAAMSAQQETPFYEEWWFLIVLALCGLILLLLVIFGLVLHGQNKKYKSCGTGVAVSTVEESVTLDNGGFTALELNSRPIHVKSTFLRKNGTRNICLMLFNFANEVVSLRRCAWSPPRPNPAGLRYSDEDICNNYNGAVSTESTALTERPAELSESEATDSDCEEEQIKHSFVNHYMSDPSYFNSWKRQQKGLKQTLACAYEECASRDGEGYYQTVVTQHSVGGVYTPAGQPATGSRTPVTGFSPHESDLRARCSVVGPVLTGQHRRAPLAFATEHQNWQICHRRLLLFTDESRFNLSTCDRRDRLWRRRGECYAPCNIIQHDWFGGGSVMVWGGISLEGRTDLYRLDNGTLTAIRYQDEILGPVVRPYAGAVGPGFLLVHNNARPHVARVCRQFLENEGIDTIDWPTGSPDLNPIEHLWDIVSVHLTPPGEYGF
ncbi:hypothetical protein NFI96_003360 [Prochilodus magdalenae]|nr:hypothetical protein NFI96_003360 [Prochilodus magdalenae]